MSEIKEEALRQDFAVFTECQNRVLITGRPRFGSVRLRFGGGMVRAVPVFGSGGSSAKNKVFLCFSTV